VNDAPVNTVPGRRASTRTRRWRSPACRSRTWTARALDHDLASRTERSPCDRGGAVIGGNGTGTVTLSGSAAQISSALAGLSYRGNLNFNGADTLTVTPRTAP
jgi:hypothetical protein